MADIPPQRVEGFTFEVVDHDGFVIREVTPLTEGTVNLQSTREVMRTINGILFPDFDDINPMRHSLVVSAEIGSDLYSLGRFRFAQRNRVIGSGIASFTMADYSCEISTPAGEAFSVGPGTAGDCILELVERFISPIRQVGMKVDPNGSPVEVSTWSAETPPLRAINDLCAENDYHPLYFDRHGNLNVRRIYQLEDSTPVADYDSLDDAESIIETLDLLRTPTLWRVVSDGDLNPVFGEYRLPLDDPMSANARGFEVISVRATQGLSGDDEADMAARSFAMNDPDATVTIEINGPIHPEYDVLDTLRYDGDFWRVRAWSIDLTAGGNMRIEAVRPMVRT